MRGLLPLVALVLAFALLAAALPAEAKPGPKLDRAAWKLVKATLRAGDATTDDALALAARLVEDAGVAGALPAPQALELRATLAQPAVRGQDDLLATVWAASPGGWRGAYWIESEAGSTSPALLALDDQGTMIGAFGGANLAASFVRVVFHFLSQDGEHTDHAARTTLALDAAPVTGAADVGGAALSERGRAPEALLVTPWNLVGRATSIGFTLRAGDAQLRDVPATACADLSAREVEPGCRALYVVPFPDEATAIDVWHLDAQGARIVDRTIARAELAAGVSYA